MIKSLSEASTMDDFKLYQDSNWIQYYSFKNPDGYYSLIFSDWETTEEYIDGYMATDLILDKECNEYILLYSSKDNRYHLLDLSTEMLIGENITKYSIDPENWFYIFYSENNEKIITFDMKWYSNKLYYWENLNDYNKNKCNILPEDIIFKEPPADISFKKITTIIWILIEILFIAMYLFFKDSYYSQVWMAWLIVPMILSTILWIFTFSSTKLIKWIFFIIMITCSIWWILINFFEIRSFISSPEEIYTNCIPLVEKNWTYRPSGKNQPTVPNYKATFQCTEGKIIKELDRWVLNLPIITTFNINDDEGKTTNLNFIKDNKFNFTIKKSTILKYSTIAQ